MNDDVRHLRQPPEEWDLARHAMSGARFVTPAEFLAGVPVHVRHDVVASVIVDALGAAADDTGVIAAFSEVVFVETYVAAVLNADLEAGETATPLVYDRFTAITLSQTLASLMVEEKLLATRGNGDTIDYRLTLPA